MVRHPTVRLEMFVNRGGNISISFEDDEDRGPDVLSLPGYCARWVMDNMAPVLEEHDMVAGEEDSEG